METPDGTDVTRRGACPACGLPVPFVRTQWGLGTPFKCKLCKSEIVIPRSNHATAFVGYVLATAFAKSFGYVIALLLLVICIVLRWPTATVRLVRRGSTDAASAPATAT
jgi:hypothetical protein